MVFELQWVADFYGVSSCALIHSYLQVVLLCITSLVNLMCASMSVSVFGDNYIIKIKNISSYMLNFEILI